MQQCLVLPHAAFQIEKKKKVINNLSCVLVLSISPNSWQPLTQLLKRTNGLAMESWDFDSQPQLQLQVPP